MAAGIADALIWAEQDRIRRDHRASPDARSLAIVLRAVLVAGIGALAGPPGSRR